MAYNKVVQCIVVPGIEACTGSSRSNFEVETCQGDCLVEISN